MVDLSKRLDTSIHVKKPNELSINKEAAEKWLSTGAQPTDTVKDLLKKAGIQ